MSDDAKVAMHPTATVVKKPVTVDVDQQRAFDVFTAGINSWWQRDHHLGDLPMTDIIIEPKEGGRCYTTQEDGKEFEWAKVLAWDPPARVVIGWQLTAEWVYDANFVTEVEVTFTSVAPKQTLVELEHRDLEKYGDAREAVVAALDSEGGWTGSMQRYADAVRNA
jgi:hypothetical protein